VEKQKNGVRKKLVFTRRRNYFRAAEIKRVDKRYAKRLWKRELTNYSEA
tara:strand:+ start:169 stop:315 length:147 start_codon:yes stop_codon:yes gene_type:complete